MIRKPAITAFLICSSLWPSALNAQTLGHGPEDQIAWWRIAAALIFCLMLAAVAAFILKARMNGQIALPRFAGAGRSTTKRRLELVETLRLKPQLDLVIVRCDGRELLLATHAQTAQLIERLGSEEA